MDAPKKELFFRELRPLSLTGLIDRAFELMRQKMTSLMALSFLAIGPLGLLFLGWLLMIHYEQEAWGTNAFLFNAATYILGIVLAVYLFFWAQSAQLLLVFSAVKGEPCELSLALQRTRTRPENILLLGPLSLFFFGFGTLFYLLPGLFFIARLGLLLPTSTLEPKLRYFQSFSRAGALSRGLGWRLLGLFFAFRFFELLGFLNLWLMRRLLVFLAHLLFGLDLSFLAQMPYSGLLLFFCTLLLLQPLKVCVMTLSYIDARVRNEAWDLQLWLDALLDKRQPTEQSSPALQSESQK